MCTQELNKTTNDEGANKCKAVKKVNYHIFTKCYILTDEMAKKKKQPIMIRQNVPVPCTAPNKTA